MSVTIVDARLQQEQKVQTLCSSGVSILVGDKQETKTKLLGNYGCPGDKQTGRAN